MTEKTLTYEQFKNEIEKIKDQNGLPLCIIKETDDKILVKSSDDQYTIAHVSKSYPFVMNSDTIGIHTIERHNRVAILTLCAQLAKKRPHHR